MNTLLKKGETHFFAIHLAHCNDLIKTISVCSIVDNDLLHRVTRVLRLRNGDECILFDQSINVHVVLRSVEQKKTCTFDVITITKNNVLQPSITFLLPVLKKDSLSAVVYSLTEMGVTTIKLVYTQKSRKLFDDKKELKRLQRVVIAAAEQAKHFAYPDIVLPKSLTDILATHECDKKSAIFFDPDGKSFLSLVPTVKSEQSLVLFIGPEGDLTIQEKKLIVDKMTFCALTPTILRASQAAALSVGIIRSIGCDK
jgi:16S rRNA (uracil1498-N3)-methyltransferase